MKWLDYRPAEVNDAPIFPTVIGPHIYAGHDGEKQP